MCEAGVARTLTNNTNRNNIQYRKEKIYKRNEDSDDLYYRRYARR